MKLHEGRAGHGLERRRKKAVEEKLDKNQANTWMARAAVWSHEPPDGSSSQIINDSAPPSNYAQTQRDPGQNIHTSPTKRNDTADRI